MEEVMATLQMLVSADELKESKKLQDFMKIS
jgi:hypothetical protein